MRITFLLDGWRDSELNEIEYSVYELGLRLNVPFTISRTANSLSIDEYIIRYSPLESDLKTIFPKIIMLTNLLSQTGLLPNTTMYNPIPYNGVKVWGIENNGLVDVVAGTRDLLLFNHEKHLFDSDYDKFNRINENSHPFITDNIAHETFIENNALFIHDLIMQEWKTNIISDPVWGENERIVVLTHDCDGPQIQSNFALLRSAILGFLKRNNKEKESFWLGSLTKLLKRPDPYWNFSNWIEFEAEEDAKSSIFIYPGKVTKQKRHFHDPHYEIQTEKFQKALQKINAAGWEIGLHSGILCNSGKGIRNSIEKLHKISGAKIESCRAHYWSYNWQNPYEYWKMLDLCGIKNDASLTIQGIGFRNGTSLPITASYYWRGFEKEPFLVFPTVFMDLYALPALLSSSNQDVRHRYELIIKTIRKQNLPPVLDWHIRTFANVGNWKGYLTAYLQLIEDLDGGRVKYTSLREASNMWKTHIKNTFLGIR